MNDDERDDEGASEDAPLAETMRPVPGSIIPRSASDVPEGFEDGSDCTRPDLTRLPAAEGDLSAAVPHVALGETLQLVHYARREDTLLISGITPHGRRLTFEQREDRQGWYVVAAGRRRRPTERELGLVVATITAEMEAAEVPERQSEVRSAYRLAVGSDQPGIRVDGLEAYRDLLLDEAAAFTAGQTDRLGVIAVDYQAFKRFANRHGHRIGAAFVQALGERLADLCDDLEGFHPFHKSGKSFRIVVTDHGGTEVQALVDRIVTEASREWLVRRVWGDKPRTHPEEVHFRIGIAMAYASERDSTDYAALAQRLSDDAYRASKLGQMSPHTSLAIAKSEYQTTSYRWNSGSEDELQELAAAMDDGPAEVMAEMSDYLHELVPSDLEGMAVAGDLSALVHCAISRDGFWQGSTAMRIAGERLLARFMRGEQVVEDELACVGGFDLGDEFYGMVIEGDDFYFARGDINSAGATRVRAGLEAVQHAVGWRREGGTGIVGHFLSALKDGSETPILERIRAGADLAFREVDAIEAYRVNDAVDIANYLYRDEENPAVTEDIVEGATLSLRLRDDPVRDVVIETQRSGFRLRLNIGDEDFPAAVSASASGLQIKLRLRKTVASAAICVLQVGRSELQDLLDEVRRENGLGEDAPTDLIGFLRHAADILLEDEIKQPAKIRMALGASYDSRDFVALYTLEDVREHHPGLFYEAVHQDLLDGKPAELDPELADLIGHTMLSSLHPSGIPPEPED